MKKEFALVKLRRSLPDLPEGATGTVVLTSQDHPTRSLVEFEREMGKPLIIAVEDDDLEEVG